MSYLCVRGCPCSEGRFFLSDFDEIWHRRLELEKKESFHWGSKSSKGIPYFTPFYPNWDLHNTFSMGVLKHYTLTTELTARVDDVRSSMVFRK